MVYTNPADPSYQPQSADWYAKLAALYAQGAPPPPSSSPGGLPDYLSSVLGDASGNWMNPSVGMPNMGLPSMLNPSNYGISGYSSPTPEYNVPDTVHGGPSVAGPMAEAQQSGSDLGSLIGSGFTSPLAGAPGSPGAGGTEGGGYPDFNQWIRQMGLQGIAGKYAATAPEAPTTDYTGMVSGQFDPVLGYLHKSIGRTKKEGKKSAKYLDTLYSGGAQQAQNTADVITRSGNRNEDRMQAIARSLDKRTVTNSERNRGKVADELKGLGLGESTGAANASARRNLDEARGFQNKESRIRGNAMATSNQNWSDFARSQANNIRLMGAQSQSDLETHISDLIFALRGQIADTKGQEASAMLAAQQAEDANAWAGSQAASSAQQAGIGAKLGLLSPYMSGQNSYLDALAQSQTAAASSSSTSPKEVGYGAAGDYIRGYLKRSGQTHGAPARNADEVITFIKNNIGNMNPVAPGQNQQAWAASELTRIWNDAGGYDVTKVPLDSLLQLVPVLFPQGVLSSASG